MVFLEMSRDEHHGGGTWGFTQCIWAPTQKKGGGAWPFWDKVRSVKAGDVIIHLRGKSPDAFFVGYSTASGDGFETTRRPPNPDEWSFSAKYFRTDLCGFTPFIKPLRLTDVFADQREPLEHYFRNNKTSGNSRRNIFYVLQGGRIQCLNGAYLSDVDDALFEILFSKAFEAKQTKAQKHWAIINTGSEIKELRVRIGQSQFSKNIRDLYNSTCCFPGCAVNDPRFLVASHIARWSDNEELRGHLGNGLCLCLIHDKAFELGVFTLTEKFEVHPNPKLENDPSPVVKDINKHAGVKIRVSRVEPLEEALLEHWIRTDQTPAA